MRPLSWNPTGTQDKHNKMERDMLLWGRVTQDAYLGTTRPGKDTPGKPKVTFRIAYDKHAFMNCITTGDTPVTRLASCLEKGDVVLVCGHWSEREYVKQDGTTDKWQSIRLEFLQVQTDAPMTNQMDENEVTEDGFQEVPTDYEFDL